MVIGDTHGSAQDDHAVRAAMAFSDYWKPSIRVHLGDALDLRWLRRSASDDEKREDVEADLDTGLRLLARWKPTHFLYGNHDYRLTAAAESGTGSLRMLAEQMIDRLNLALGDAKVLPWCKRRGVLRLGNMALLHGYSHGQDAPRKAARAYAVDGGYAIMGHTHRIEQSTCEGIDPKVGMSIGCLCDLNMDYTLGNLGTLSQRHGWAYGVIKHGRAVIWQAQRVGGEWLLPTELRSIPA